MSLFRAGTPDLAGRILVRLTILCAASLLASSPAPAAGESTGSSPECRTGALADVAEGDVSLYPAVDPSIPGWWRQELRSSTPHRRVPGTLQILPKTPAPAEVATDGRWLPGYRPATPRARAEFEAWKAGQNSTKATVDGADVPRSTSSHYAANLISGERVTDVPEEKITRTVHEQSYEVSTIDPREITASEELKPKPKGPASDYHHGSSMTWNEYLMVKELAKTAPVTVEGQDAAAESLRAPTVGSVGFDAIQSNGTSVPPDPIMAAGPNHLIAIVNRSYQIWDKSGTQLFPTDVLLDDFFDGMADCDGVFDVFVDYDEAQDRFVMGGMSVFSTIGTDSYLCVAASATNDPTGAWHRTSFRADANDTDTWIDYPHMGIGLDAIYIGGNMYLDGGGLDHVRLFAVDKTALYNGTSVAVVDANVGSAYFTAQPVKLHGYTSGGWPAPGTPHHFIAHNGGGSSRIWRWSNPFVTDPVVYGTIAEANFGGVPPTAPELGGTASDENDTGSAKWLDAEYRNGKLWATRNVLCNIDDGATESCIDWVQIDVSGSTPVLDQQQSGGAYGSADDFRYFPDLSVDRNNNIAIGYTKSSSTTYTEVWVTGREFDDTPGTLQAETLQRAGLGTYVDGAGCQGACDRWGDYTGLTVDPDGCTFWYLGQYSDGGYFNWGTHIGSFRYDTCSVDSSLQVDKGTYTCDDSIEITVTDSTPINAATVSAQTTISTSGGDTETVPAGSWSGSDCAGSDCGTWAVTLPVSGASGSSDDGTVNVNDGETITAFYDDPHGGHAGQTRNVTVGCQTRLSDGGYIIEGGCEAQAGTETYNDYIDGGEYIAYTFGIFNPQTSLPLTDVLATLQITGPAADKVTIFNPAVYIGTMDRGALSGAVFQLYVDPSIDDAAFRMSDHDFNLNITSAAEGYTVAQVLTQQNMLQTDDNIVEESQCWNFEAGDQGFVNVPAVYGYECAPPNCPSLVYVNSVASPWTHGSGCGSETRSDYPEMSCDTGGTNAFKSNSEAGSCNTFAQSSSQLTNDILYSPIFAPASTGNAANGQPWNFNWRYAEWFYNSEMESGSEPAMTVGFFWDDDYPGVSVPGQNEIFTYYPFFYGFFYYRNQTWDSSTPWDPANPPANLDGLGFGGAASGGAAATGTQWRWAVNVYDADLGGDPNATPATSGLALDNLNLIYDQYHAEGQVGTCLDPPAVLSLDQFSYLECPSDSLGVSVLDGSAAGSVRVTVQSQETGDSETFLIYGAGPNYSTALPYSTAGGPMDNDGTLFVLPQDLVVATYEDGSSSTFAYIDCVGGDVVADGIAGLSDNGDGDSYADTNETVDISILIRNNTGQTLDNVTAIISSDDPMIDCITKDSASFGSIAGGGGTGSNSLASDPFTFKVSADAQCADPLSPPVATFQVLILADDFAGPVTPQQLTMVLDLNDLPGTITFTENFSTEPAAFHHQLGPGDDDGASTSPDGASCSPYVDEFFWRSTGGNSGGGYFCWQDPADDFPDGAYSDLNDSALYSPVLKIGSSSTTLGFDHEYQFGWTGEYRVDGARVDYSVNGGAWQKLTTLPYDGTLIWNTYCNPLCNGSELGAPCFTEATEVGEMVFNQLDSGFAGWASVSGAVSGLSTGDQVQFRWRVGSMNTSAYGISTLGGYGLDNVSVTNVVEQVCDAASNPDTGCGVVFDGFGNLTQICGDDDALIEPTERWSVDVTLRNSSVSAATNTVADLSVSVGSDAPATVTSGTGSYGTLGAAGGTGSASYEFIVDRGAICITDILFDVGNIADDGAFHSDQPAAFTVPVGGVSSQEVASQSVSPLIASGSVVSSPLLPALGVPTPANSATVDYGLAYTNVQPEEVGPQSTDPLVVENTSTLTNLGAPFTLSDSTAISAVIDWTSLTHSSLTSCVRVFVRPPSGFDFTLKDTGEVASPPYDIMSLYQHPNGGPGQYQIGVEELGGGQCKNDATLSGAAMTVTGPSTTGSWTINAKVSLWDGSAEHVLKNFGQSDAAPYDVTSIYNAAGPGTYELRLEESSGGGLARLSTGTLVADGVECDLGCTSIAPPAPPLADGWYGTGITLARGAGADEIVVTIDNATCSDTRAVVLYGSVGDYSSYLGAVDAGCDIGSGPSATITHAGDDVWFNVIWVNVDDAAGHPGWDSSGASRIWDAAGMCGVASDDTADAVCD